MLTVQAPFMPTVQYSPRNIPSARVSAFSAPVIYPTSPQQIRFGICVNKATAAINDIELIMRESLQKRLHIAAELGRTGVSEHVDVLTDLLLGKNDGTHNFLKVINAEDRDDQMKKVVLISLLESFKNGELDEASRRKILEALKEARKKGFLSRVKPLIEDIIKTMEGQSSGESHDMQHARHDWVHALGVPHDHGDGQHHHHH